MGSLFPRLTSAGMGTYHAGMGTYHAYFRLPRLSDRLALGTSADGGLFKRWHQMERNQSPLERKRIY
jgi:hypothetical protein